MSLRFSTSSATSAGLGTSLCILNGIERAGARYVEEGIGMVEVVERGRINSVRLNVSKA